MFSNVARFLMVSAAASLVSFGSADAEACTAFGDEAEALIASGAQYGAGASFITTVIKEAMGWTGDHIRHIWGSTSPGSPIYYDNITLGVNFTRITNIYDIQRGDILTIDATDSYSGHSVMILEAPEELTVQLKPRWADTLQWAVKIADSTTSAHGCNSIYPDSRWEGDCKNGGVFHQGPGTGYIRLYTDLTGEFIGYTWSITSVSDSQYYSPSVRPYAVGRTPFCSI